MTEFMRPMLACSLLKPSVEHTDFNIHEAMKKLRYPVLATIKKDGIRAIKLGDLASRTLKKIPNRDINERAAELPYGLDMELFNPELSYDEIESIVMSREHKDSSMIGFHILDMWGSGNEHIKYEERIFTTHKECKNILGCYGEQPSLCNNADELFEHFKRFESEEGEGICFRTPDSPYKQGRSTLREQYLVKLSRYIRSECTIIGFEEQMMNGNAEKRDDIGYMRRRQAGVNLIGKSTLGAFIVQTSDVCQTCQGMQYTDPPENSNIKAIACHDCKGSGRMTFRVGTGVGLTDTKRAEIWDTKDKWLGKQITIKSKGHGVKVKPRSPIFIGCREEGY